jgi:hypothetical protein
MEATTEIIATMVRYRLDRTDYPFATKQLEAVCGYGAYMPQLNVLNELLDREFGEQAKPISWLVWDYLTGSNDFLRTLRRQNEYVYETLKYMHIDLASVIETALRLGYTKLASQIEEEYAE